MSDIIISPGCYLDIDGNIPASKEGDLIALWVLPDGQILSQPEMSKRPKLEGGIVWFTADPYYDGDCMINCEKPS